MSEKNKDFLDRFFKYPWLIVGIIGLITVFFAFQLPRAELDNNNLRFIPETDEARLTSEYIDDIFGSSLFILVGLERRFGDVFDPAFLNQMREFNQRIEAIEIVGNVNSIVSSDYIFAEEDELGYGAIVVRRLVEDDFSGTPEEIAVLRQRILSWDIYRRTLISDDFRATQILVPLEIPGELAGRPESTDMFIEIRDIAREMFSPYANVFVTGIPIISATINEAMRSDLITMIPLVMLVVLLLHFFAFRRFTLVVLPLITVLVAVVWSIGAMPLVGIQLSVVSSVLPVILVAVGSAYGIHIITHYLAGADKITGMSNAEHSEMVISILRKIGKAVFLAAITTMAGFSSFCFTTVVPIREFGFFATFGVLVSFINSVTLIPSLLIIRGPRDLKPAAAKPEELPAVDRNIGRFFERLAMKKGMVIFAVVLTLSFSIWGITRLVVDNIFIEYFRAGTDIARSDRFIRENFGGSKVVSVVVRAQSTEELLMPQVLGAVDSLASYLEERVPEVGNVMGFTDFIKRINQVFNAGESPDGLQPVAAPIDDFGFGFGFGFDDFGFGDFGFDTIDVDPVPVTPRYAQAEDEALSAVELIRMLREAVFAGRDRNMDANSLIREMERLINFEGAAFYEIPAIPARYGRTTYEELSQLIANYLILLSGSISAYSNDPLSPTAIRTIVQLRTVGDDDTARAINRINDYIYYNFPPGIETIIGGSALVESSLNRLVVQSQLTSVIISVFVVMLIIALFNRSIVAGIISVAPLSICVLVNFAIMGLSGVKLNLGTSMMATLCVGIGIDYTIHYLEAYKREYRASGGKGNFLFRTFAISGKAILINAVSVGAGFAVLIFSQFVILQELGFLITFAMASSALVSLTVFPVLLLLIKPKFIYQGESHEQV